MIVLDIFSVICVAIHAPLAPGPTVTTGVATTLPNSPCREAAGHRAKAGPRIGYPLCRRGCHEVVAHPIRRWRPSRDEGVQNDQDRFAERRVGLDAMRL